VTSSPTLRKPLPTSDISNQLNPEKCTFGVPQGELLGYIITKCGIKANPDKISAITKIGQVRNVKDVQRLMGCPVALSYFMSRLGDMLFKKLLKKADSFSWMEEMWKALHNLKALILKPPVLASSEPDETLLLYVVATTQVISTALVVEQGSLGTCTRYNDQFTT
jgi:hypothetical protein